MVTLLLSIIYLCFISLGLPDSMLGSAWPSIYSELDVPISYMGIISVIVCSGTIISSLFTDKLTKKISDQGVIVISILLTSLALFGYSFANAFWMLCLFSIIYGLGAGAIDATLNNYVALHFSSRVMTWLHGFWGVGTLIGPYVLSYQIGANNGWQAGYRFIGFIQLLICLIVICTLPLWKKVKHKQKQEGKEIIPADLTFKEKLQIKGVLFVLVAFFCYCALETTAMNWASTYLYEYRKISNTLAAALGSLFFIGITVGRFISGIISSRISDKGFIRIGSLIIIVGIILIVLPVKTNVLSYIGIVTIGFGCAPIYPCIIHYTPIIFPKEKAQAIIGLQMSFAYMGSLTMGPLFGVVAKYIDIRLFPFYILFFVAIMTLLLEIMYKKVCKEKVESNQ